MANIGNYLYGFTDTGFQPEPELRGLAGAPIRVISFREIAAVVSRHPVQRLMPSRSNIEPHHRVVRHVSSRVTLVPAAFGHITDSESQILEVLRGNYENIRDEIERLDHKGEMSVKLRWNVGNIFDHLVRTNRELQNLRDRVFRSRQPTMNEKLQVGGAFEATLVRERERLTRVLLAALDAVACDSVSSTPRSEKTVCELALLVEQAHANEFRQALQAAAGMFDSSFTFEYSGPWPAYSFVKLHLQSPGASHAA
jgi:hypothetical protein